MHEPDYSIQTIIHVAQIAEYLKFNQQLRDRGGLNGFHAIPIGYSDFCAGWNNGASPTDQRRVCSVYLSYNPANHDFEIFHTPVHLHEFHITPEQVNYYVPNSNQPSAALQADVNQEFFALLVAQQKKQRQHYEERKEKRLQGPYLANYNSGGSSQRRGRNCHHYTPTTVPSPSPISFTFDNIHDTTIGPQDFITPMDTDLVAPMNTNHVAPM
jgi:hypothetical protein